jgi:ATP-dependent Clp protease ATP-binding subunit ClpA
MEAARSEALRRGHRCATSEPEHLLLALSGQSDGIAARILRDLGVSDEQVRGQLGELLASEAPRLAAHLRRPACRRLRHR